MGKNHQVTFIHLVSNAFSIVACEKNKDQFYVLSREGVERLPLPQPEMQLNKTPSKKCWLCRHWLGAYVFTLLRNINEVRREVKENEPQTNFFISSKATRQEVYSLHVYRFHIVDEVTWYINSNDSTHRMLLCFQIYTYEYMFIECTDLLHR